MRRFSWEPRVRNGDRHNQLTVLDNTVIYGANSVRHIIVRCDCGNEYTMREYEFLHRRGTGLCRSCSMAVSATKRRVPDNESAKNDYRNDYIQGAKARGYEFSLTKEQFESLIFSTCYYCGATPNKRKTARSSTIMVNGVDRYDNTIGYTTDNSVAACWTCNSAKRKMHGDEFIQLANSIAKLKR